MSRRVTIKTLLVNQRNASPQSLAKHLRYIERDGAGRNGEPGRAYGPQTDEADLDAFKERCQDDRHHFRFIVSPEDSAELDDLRTYTRHLMNRMEADLGTRLDWVAVDHWNSGRYALLDDGMGFSLVPWRPIIEPRLGQQIAATVRGGGVSWEVGRQRGPGIGSGP
ncbi:hypothetical protein BA763_24375 [Burkholderia cenocepacia]|nr:hypothetical protein BA763_24375 [Burkholderia cenocepacia]